LEILIYGKPYGLVAGPMGDWSLVWPAFVYSFGFAFIFVSRSGWPRIALALTSASIASYISEQLVAFPPVVLTLVASCRLLFALVLFVVVFRQNPPQLFMAR